MSQASSSPKKEKGEKRRTKNANGFGGFGDSSDFGGFGEVQGFDGFNGASGFGDAADTSWGSAPADWGAAAPVGPPMSFQPPTASTAFASSSTGAEAANGYSWTIDSERLARYEGAFRRADRNQDGFVEAVEAREVLERSLLPEATLRRIWTMSDVDRDGRLSFAEFLIAVHLAFRLSKDGLPPPTSLPAEFARLLASPPPTPSPLPLAPPQPAAAATASQSPGATPASSTTSPWSLEASEVEMYTSIFQQLETTTPGFVDHAAGREVFERSQLPIAELSHIWRVSDLDGDGRLAKDEFLAAMGLIARRRRGAPLVERLPPELHGPHGSQASSPVKSADTGGSGPDASVVIAAEGSDSSAPSAQVEVRAEMDAAPPVAPAIEDSEGRPKEQLKGDDITELSETLQQSDADPRSLDAVATQENEEVLESMTQAAQTPEKIATYLEDSSPDSPAVTREISSPTRSAETEDPASQAPVLPPASSSSSAEVSPSPTVSPAASSSPWAAREEELNRYRAILSAKVDPSNSGFAGTVEAREVMAQSGLPRDDLQHIWNISDMDGDGRLSATEFMCAMCLVGRRRQGAPLVPALPPELLASLGVPKESSASDETESMWTYTEEEWKNYLKVFSQLDSEDTGLLGATEARSFFESSGLPTAELSQIWRLADVGKDGKLSADEFACATILVARRRQHGVELPQTLPSPLAALASGNSSASPSTPPDSSAAAPSPTENAPLPAAQPKVDAWTVEPSEMARYTSIFEGFGAGKDEDIALQIKQVLESSQLPAEDLSHIWRLAMASGGRPRLSEFVCAMALVGRRRQGAPLVTSVPPSLAQQCLQLNPPAAETTEVTAPEDDSAVSWTLSSDELTRYHAAFQAADTQQTGLVGAQEGRGLFEKSGLPVEELGHIWRLSDRDQDGSLAPIEFVCAMAVMMRRRAGAPLPKTVPPQLVSELQRVASSELVKQMASRHP